MAENVRYPELMTAVVGTMDAFEEVRAWMEAKDSENYPVVAKAISQVEMGLAILGLVGLFGDLPEVEQEAE